MKSKTLMVILAIMALVTFSFNHAVAQGFSFYLQHEVYETGEQQNKVWMNPENGLLDVNTVHLFYDENDNEISLSEINRVTTTTQVATYNGDVFSGFVQKTFTSYSGLVQDPLPTGLYRLEAKDPDGNEYVGHFEFVVHDNQPIISSRSFSYYFDDDGSFVWSWAVPTDLSAEDYIVRTYIVAGHEELEQFRYRIDLPPDRADLIIPKDQLNFEALTEQGYTFVIFVHLLSNDASSNSLSRRINMIYWPDADVIIPSANVSESIGLAIENWTNETIEVNGVHPDDILDTTNRPTSLKYGLFNLELGVPIGATVRVRFYFPEALSAHPKPHEWFKYSSDRGWYDYSDNAEFNATRDQVVITLVDGGAGDDDKQMNGKIVDPSGPGISSSGGSSGSSGGGGCFIATAACSSGL